MNYLKAKSSGIVTFNTLVFAKKMLPGPCRANFSVQVQVTAVLVNTRVQAEPTRLIAIELLQTNYLSLGNQISYRIRQLHLEGNQLAPNLDLHAVGR